MSREEALEIIARDRSSRLCLNAVEALEAHSLELEGL
jgi:hypothetical protein